MAVERVPEDAVMEVVGAKGSEAVATVAAQWVGARVAGDQGQAMTGWEEVAERALEKVAALQAQMH